jgi:hypothetical protein
MARVQPALSETETALVEQMAALTRSKRSEVMKNALAVYHWFIRQAITGTVVVARKPTGEETVIETAELAALQGQSQLLPPEELGALGKRLAATKDVAEAARLRERITRGFYGI